MFFTSSLNKASSSQLLLPAINRHLRDLVNAFILSYIIINQQVSLSSTWSNSRISNPYLSATSLPKNLPPTKCLPLKNFTLGFGAVKLIKYSGMNPCPTCPSSGGPSVTFHELGVSIERTGTLVVSSNAITSLKGSLTGAWKEKPKRASTTREVLERAEGKSVVKGMCRAESWVVRRWKSGAEVGFG
jgi:hypothetical protein